MGFSLRTEGRSYIGINFSMSTARKEVCFPNRLLQKIIFYDDYSKISIYYTNTVVTIHGKKLERLYDSIRCFEINEIWPDDMCEKERSELGEEAEITHVEYQSIKPTREEV
jgi:hypothetical protein